MLGFDYIKRLFQSEGEEELYKKPDPKKGYFDLSTLEGEIENKIVDSFSDVGGLISYGFESTSDGFSNINDLIIKYREMSLSSDIDDAIQEIVNECVIKNDDEIVDINLDKVDLSDSIKEKINIEFKNLLYTMDFEYLGDEIFRQWFIDGRLYVQNIYDPEDLTKGIVDFNILNPFNISRITSKESGKQYYIYKLSNKETNYYNFNYEQKYNGFIIPDEHINFIPSGLRDSSNNYYLSYLHKAIKPYNHLRLVEDSSVILRLTRGVEKRIFKINTGKLVPKKAEEHVKNLMNKFRNRVVYDPTTGGILQQKNVMTMAEDFWIPVSSDGEKGTSIDIVPGTQNLGEMGDVTYHRQKLLSSLHVPYGRFNGESSSTINYGDSAKEIARDEMRFSKFNNRLREKFGRGLFLPILKKHIIVKNIIDISEWNQIQKNIRFTWSKDQHYEEIAKQERLKGKLELLSDVSSLIGKNGYFSKEFAYKEVLGWDDEDIKLQRKKIEFEEKTGNTVVADSRVDDEYNMEDELDNFDNMEEPEETESSMEEPDVKEEPEQVK